MISVSKLFAAGSCAIVLAACGPGPTTEPKTEASPAKAVAVVCPKAAPTIGATIDKTALVSGKRVAKVCVYGVDGENKATAEKAIRLKDGDKLDAMRVREDISALVKTVVIDDVVVSAVPQGDEVIVSYALKDRPRIGELTFDGANVFEKEGLTGKIQMEKLRPLVMNEVYELANMMRDEYKNRGYRSIKIDTKVESSGPGLVRLKFSVVEGPQWKMGKVAFKGAARVSDPDLRKAAALEKGAPFSDDKVERATLMLSSLYLDRGMLNAKIEPATGEPDKDGAANVTFSVVEGEVFRIGALKVAKLGAADEKNLLAKLKSKPNQVLNRSQLLDDVKTLTETFLARGQKVEIATQTDVDAKKKTVDVVFEVEALPGR